ncbi:transcription termination factor Rho [Leucobacter sp. wl10]|uniref:transcription termination factor Rho n=1 Tax=Leucobacter sp. wl10 TaxID=2304677 RepID=UPI001F08C892|nr:transcription termination factor Rho [Leucobacter sp. wl10]
METNVEDTNNTPVEEAAPVRRRASRRATAAAGATSEAVAAEAGAVAGAPVSAPAAAAAPAAEEALAEAPKKRATRSRKKPVEAEAPAAETSADGAGERNAPVQAAAAEEAPAEAPKKRATRSRKKPVEAEAPAAETSADGAGERNAPVQAAAAEEAPAEAPKKRATRSRKKPVEAEAPAAETSADGAGERNAPVQAAAAEEAPAEAPKKRATRSRKKPVEAEAPAADRAGAEEAGPAAEGDRSAEAETAPDTAPAKRGRSRRAQAAEAAPDAGGEKSEQDAAAKPEAEKPEGEKGEAGAAESERQGRSRRGRGRSQKVDNADSGEAAEQSSANDEGGKGRGHSQNGDKNGDNSARSSRTRQRDRKRRGQNDDLEPEITEDDVLLPIAGILDVLDNYAFVRTSGYLPGTSDVYVSLGQVKKYGLRRGDAVAGAIRQPREGDGGGRQKYNAIVKVDSVNGRPADENEKRADLAELIPVFPQERLRLETSQDRLVGRAIDIAAPIGLGQRGLLVIPEQRSGVAVLGEIAHAVSANKPDAHLMLVLADAQPEEITQLQRTVAGEVVAASFDRPAEDQATIAELAVDRAKRLVELGHDVVVLIDSLNRLARAYAQAQHTAARPGLDEIDEFALGQIKRLLAAARNVENGGSLTVLATVHAKTGIDADKMLLREVRAVVNSEIRFKKAQPGLAPVVDLSDSLTRNVDALLGADEAVVLARLRAALDHDDASEKALERLRATGSNSALLAEIQRSGKF